MSCSCARRAVDCRVAPGATLGHLLGGASFGGVTLPLCLVVLGIVVFAVAGCPCLPDAGSSVLTSRVTCLSHLREAVGSAAYRPCL
jgi:hypothetical protein